MVRHGAHLWAKHPHVANDLTLGERAADRLKTTFGSWAFLIGLNGFIALWCVANATKIVHFDVYPFIALNLILSWLAAQQGGALQIAANRGDRLNAEVALHTQANTDALMRQSTEIKTLTERQTTMLQQHTQMLTEIRQLRAEIAAGTDDSPPPAT